MVNAELSSSLVGPGRVSRVHEGDDVILGIFCVYMTVGTIGDFFITYLTAPTLCQYVFGPMGDAPRDRVTVGQCNVAASASQLPWLFNIFYGFIVDAVPFFGSRRRGWILFGWTGGLTMLALTAAFAEHFVATHQFGTYLYMLMGMCFFYTFADVAADGLVIELSKHEPEDRKGYIMTTCQLLRYTMMTISTACGTLFMSGRSYQPPGGPQQGAFVMPFELSLGQIHWMLFFMALPFYVGMWVWLRDPPAPEQHASICSGLRSSGKLLWTSLKSFAVFMILIELTGFCGIAVMLNPASQGLSSISKPSNIQSSIGALIGSFSLTLGIWTFRKFFLTKNWRISLFMMQPLMALTSALSLLTVYNTWGISRNGWFNIVQNNVPPNIGSMIQVVSLPAIIEISPPGLEATLYELFFSAYLGAIALSVALQTLFVRPFDLGDVNSVTWNAHPEMVPTYERRLELATIFALVVNVCGGLVFMWFLPGNAAECRRWAAKVSWHTNGVACLNLFVYVVPVAYASYMLISNLADPG